MRNYRVTGPVEAPRSTLDAMHTRMMSHRSAQFRTQLTDILDRLKPLFGTSQDVLPLTCSGTGGMEAAVASVLRPGDRVLVVELGYFGHRFAELATHNGADVDVIAAPWGELVPTEAITARLSAGQFDAVLLTHNETSTGVVAPLREWATAIRAVSDCLILVDVVSSLGAVEVAFDELGLDVAVGVPQKALACPPGLALVAVSERALTLAARPGGRAYYLDLVRAAEHARQGTTTYTPALSILFALDAALAAIEEEGLAQVQQRHEKTAARCRQALRAQGLTVVPAEEHCSPTVTAVRLPVQQAERVRDMLADRYDVWVSSGRAGWKDDVVRIGHMGPVTEADVESCAEALGACVRDIGATAGNTAMPAAGAGAAIADVAVEVRSVATAQDLGPEWDDLVAHLNAPVFHTRDFLRAYEHHPIQQILEPRYLEIRGTGGELLAAAPTYLQGDPLNLLGLADGEQALLAPMWHAPDSHLLARDVAALSHLREAFAARAAEVNASLWGFINISADSPLVGALEDSGFRRRDLVPRWTLKREDAPNAEAYLDGMRRSVRRDYARQLRRYEEQASCFVHRSTYPGLLGLLEMIAASAARNGSPKYYNPEPFAQFLRELGEPVRLVEIRSNAGETLAVAVCFLEENRLQAWAGGYIRGREDLKFSPYYALWWNIAELMWETGVDTIECGRLNETFKEKMLLVPQNLVAMVGPSN
ncbi:aminotransferase class V-fold PLP-dependent enzyme [Streptomyces sp. NPDC059928]|uniref:aminotransferase class V-fold PLP-dependent enzyme n=1 Tax=unclassified Streptomyces TaxID=2593676 RepID=UPI003656B883